MMHSNAYAYLSDEDLGALVAYLKQLPPVDSELDQRVLQFPGTLIFGLMGFNTMPINLIDHEAVGGSAPTTGPGAAYGEYLVEIGVCRECHSANLAANTNPNGPPMGPNITPGGALVNYNEAQFLAFMRTGMRPDGRQVSDEMPVNSYRHQIDE